ncbi:MAG: phenylacetic acid degradation protein [Deltaproteobacteria bacterium HGW-Deltaproteobacteria-4]|nr:MAG: phenylacetic acid degradation protein [Deltaproteobacteria bacterium HGW-Deltaproteobacteria-4]
MHKIKAFFDEHDHFARHVGIELLEIEPGMARARMAIAPHHFNGANTVHGGAIFTLADFVFAVASNSYGPMAMGINTSVSFVKAAISGTLYAEAEEQSRNPKLATYTVNVTDDSGDLVALFQGMVYLKKTPIISQDAPQG